MDGYKRYGLTFREFPKSKAVPSRDVAWLPLVWLLWIFAATYPTIATSQEQVPTLPIVSLPVAYPEDGISMERLAALTETILQGEPLAQVDRDLAAQLGIHWFIDDKTMPVDAFAAWMATKRDFIQQHPIPMLATQEGMLAYFLSHQRIREIPSEAFDQHFGSGTHKALTELYEARDRQIFLKLFAPLHPELAELYQPGENFFDIYTPHYEPQFVTEYDRNPPWIDMDRLEKQLNKLNRALVTTRDQLRELGLLDDQDNFLPMDALFEHVGIDAESGRLIEGGRAAAQQLATIQACINDVQARGYRYSNRKLLGGARVSASRKRAEIELEIRNAVGAVVFHESLPKQLTAIEQLLLEGVALPVKVWIVGGMIAYPVAISLLTAGVVGGEISTHGVGVHVGLPGTQWGPVGFGITAGARFGLAQPLLGQTPILPGLNLQFNVGGRGPKGLMAGLFLNHNLSYDFTLAGVGGGALGFVYGGYDVLHGNLFANLGPFFAVSDPRSGAVDWGVTVGVGAQQGLRGKQTAKTNRNTEITLQPAQQAKLPKLHLYTNLLPTSLPPGSPLQTFVSRAVGQGFKVALLSRKPLAKPPIDEKALAASKPITQMSDREIWRALESKKEGAKPTNKPSTSNEVDLFSGSYQDVVRRLPNEPGGNAAGSKPTQTNPRKTASPDRTPSREGVATKPKPRAVKTPTKPMQGPRAHSRTSPSTPLNPITIVDPLVANNEEASPIGVLSKEEWEEWQREWQEIMREYIEFLRSHPPAPLAIFLYYRALGREVPMNWQEDFEAAWGKDIDLFYLLILQQHRVLPPELLALLPLLQFIETQFSLSNALLQSLTKELQLTAEQKRAIEQFINRIRALRPTLEGSFTLAELYEMTDFKPSAGGKDLGDFLKATAVELRKIRLRFGKLPHETRIEKIEKSFDVDGVLLGRMVGERTQVNRDELFKIHTGKTADTVVITSVDKNSPIATLSAHELYLDGRFFKALPPLPRIEEQTELSKTDKASVQTDFGNHQVDLFLYSPAEGDSNVVHGNQSAALLSKFGDWAHVTVGHSSAWQPSRETAAVAALRYLHRYFWQFLDPATTTKREIIFSTIDPVHALLAGANLHLFRLRQRDVVAGSSSVVGTFPSSTGETFLIYATDTAEAAVVPKAPEQEIEYLPLKPVHPTQLTKRIRLLPMRLNLGNQILQPQIHVALVPLQQDQTLLLFTEGLRKIVNQDAPEHTAQFHALLRFLADPEVDLNVLADAELLSRYGGPEKLSQDLAIARIHKSSQVEEPPEDRQSQFERKLRTLMHHFQQKEYDKAAAMLEQLQEFAESPPVDESVASDVPPLVKLLHELQQIEVHEYSAEELDQLYKEIPYAREVASQLALPTFAGLSALVRWRAMVAIRPGAAEVDKTLATLEQVELGSLIYDGFAEDLFYLQPDQVVKIPRFLAKLGDQKRKLKEYHWVKKQLLLFDILESFGLDIIPGNRRMVLTEDGHVGFAMEFVRGFDLRESNIEFALFHELDPEVIKKRVEVEEEWQENLRPPQVVPLMRDPHMLPSLAKLVSAMEKHHFRIIDMQFRIREKGLVLIDPREILIGDKEVETHVAIWQDWDNVSEQLELLKRFMQMIRRVNGLE